MSGYRRVMAPGGTFFFTVVTFDRKPILTSVLSRQTLRRAWQTVQEKHPFKCDAIPPWRTAGTPPLYVDVAGE